MNKTDISTKARFSSVLPILLIAIALVIPTSLFAQSETVTLNWTAPGDDGSSGQASYYDIRYSTSMITDANWDFATQVDGEPSPQMAGSSETFDIGGLQASTTYYFAMKVADEAMNWSGLSNVITKSTSAETTSPSAIADLLVTSTSDNSVDLSWTAPGDDGTVGQASAYDIRYSTVPITIANWNSAIEVSGEPAPQTSGSSESITINGLDQETTYYFAIRTADEVPNWSGLSNVVNTTTIDLTPPATILDLSAVTGASNGTIGLEWTAPGDDGMTGNAALYEIRYSTNNINSGNWLSASLYLAPPIPANAGQLESHTLTGLTPGQQYYVAVRTYDNSGNPSQISNVPSAEAGINISTDIDDNENNLPDSYNLSQNYPNPFNPTTTIEFSLPENSYVNLSVFNVTGRKVKTLYSDQMAAGNYAMEWDATDDYGIKVATGMYIYKLTTETFTSAKKMVLLK